MTLTVPQNALAETVTFAIQPITNKVGNGLGNAYRLEPDGKTFTTPLEISDRYDDHDLEGTAPEALTIAFQDNERRWHLLDPTRIDAANRLITFSTNHFTDFSFLAKFRLEPSKATLRVGESLHIRLIGCEGRAGDIDEIKKPLGIPAKSCRMGGQVVMFEWFADIGTITPTDNPALYTAPSKKPTPNVATVSFPYALNDYIEGWGINPFRGPPKRGMFTSKITIIDWGYRATGQSDGLSFSGVICSLEQPFSVNGQSMLSFKFNFTPSSLTAGTVEITGSGYDVTIRNGSGTYAIERLAGCGKTHFGVRRQA